MTPSTTYSCKLSAAFDWSLSTSSGKETTSQQAYLFSTLHLKKVNNVESQYPFSVVDTRLKIKGTGRVMRLRYESEEGKDFQLVGHTTPFTAETEG